MNGRGLAGDALTSYLRRAGEALGSILVANGINSTEAVNMAEPLLATWGTLIQAPFNAGVANGAVAEEQSRYI